MSIKCTIGWHEWDHCTCKNCKKTRNEHHNFEDDCEKCSICGAVVENQHNWSKDCQKCSKCGKTSEREHHWLKDCEKCSVCGKVRVGHHKLEHGICLVCGNGTYTDQHQGINYRIKKIGQQVIMVDNFASTPASGNFWAYDNDKNVVFKNGYLYDLETAKKLAPHGWHIPTKAEWETLVKTLASKEKTLYEQLKVGSDSGFDGLLSGFRNARGAYNSMAASGYYWSSTDENEKEAWHFKLSALKGQAELEKVDKACGLSVRYFRD